MGPEVGSSVLTQVQGDLGGVHAGDVLPQSIHINDLMAGDTERVDDLLVTTGVDDAVLLLSKGQL